MTTYILAVKWGEHPIQLWGFKSKKLRAAMMEECSKCFPGASWVIAEYEGKNE